MRVTGAVAVEVGPVGEVVDDNNSKARDYTPVGTRLLTRHDPGYVGRYRSIVDLLFLVCSV